jgi:CRISPR-associated exonuclease Cas4
MTDDDDYLLISGIQHFDFCKRQWALIHIETLWADNALTVSGEIMHERVHDSRLKEKRGELIISRGMPVFSRTMMVRGVCDVVEFHSDSGGVSLAGRSGLWSPTPVEYKRGSPKVIDADRLQLCAQAMCLEEMLVCPAIQTAYLFYGETKHREEIALDTVLREQVRKTIAEMRSYYERRYTPRVKPGKGCRSCSMRDVCLPEMPEEGRVSAYIQKAILDDGDV